MTAEANLFVDLSSNNPVPSRRALKKHWKAGRRILVLKVSQGTGYTWSESSRLAKIWHSLGGTVGHYHWLSPGSAAFGAEQADFFWGHVQADVQHGDILIEDLEQQGALEPEHAAFWARITEHVTHSGLQVEMWTYSGAYFLRDTAKAKPHSTRWWGAGYPNLPFTPRGWQLVAHQYTDKGTSPGFGSTTDLSELLKPLRHPRPPKKAKRLSWGPIRRRVFGNVTRQVRDGAVVPTAAVTAFYDLGQAYQAEQAKETKK